ncbi:unnamed protein product, partial [Brassica rapa subsp. narinosa]
DSKTHAVVDSQISADHSLFRCENLISQNTYLHQLQSFSRSHLVSFLLEQKFCSGCVSTSLSKTIIDN